jgi:hypothetical protein
MDPRQMTDIDIYELAPPLERGEPRGEPHYAPSRAFDVEHTRLDLDIDQEAGEVRGRATITVKPFADGLSEIWFDAAEMSFARVAIKRGRKWKDAPSFKTYEDKIWIALAFMKEKRGIDLAIEWSSDKRPQNARIGAMGALGVLAKEHKGERERVIKQLREVLKDPSARVRIAATRALGRTGDAAVLKILREVERTEAISQIRVASHRGIESIEESARKAPGV